MRPTLAELLAEYLANVGWSFSKLHDATEVPRNTIYRWLQGEVTRVRDWRQLAKVGSALRLKRTEMDLLLEAAGQSSLDTLLKVATSEADQNLLAPWTRRAAENLPHHLTSFVGRREELDRLVVLLRSARLVTLTGTGGAGKTRLALAAAASMLDEYDGVWFVDLSSIHDPNLVIPTISRTIGLHEDLDESPVSTLIAHVRSRQVLLVLDNLEQVIQVATDIARLLESTQQTTALVTSRSRLGIGGEHEVSVKPLPLPPADAGFSELKENPAVKLFVDRAQAVDGSFRLTPSNASTVAEICRYQEGLPLGIELAAGRTRQVGLDSMLAQFPGRLTMADRGPGSVPDRQRTLANTIAWSYDLLTEPEQRLLDGISVFAGGFTRNAADQVCCPGSNTTLPDGVDGLVEQSLVQRARSGSGQPRYELLESVREFAAERLATSGMLELTRHAHAEFFLGLIEHADLNGKCQSQWVRTLSPELGNLRAALEWCHETGQNETGLRLSLALMPLWQLQDLRREALVWLDTFMAARDDVSPGLKAKGLLWLGLLQVRLTGRATAAIKHFGEALALFQKLGDHDGASEALQAEADVARQREQWAEAEKRYAESVELAKSTGNAYLTAHGYMGLALSAQSQRKLDDASEHWDAVLVWARKSGNEVSIALAINGLGELARERHDWKNAEKYYKECLRVARDLGSKTRMALALHNLGHVALHKGDGQRAQNLFRESLHIYVDHPYVQGVVECFAGLATVMARDGKNERAAHLCGAITWLMNGLQLRLDPIDRDVFEQTKAQLRSDLGDAYTTFCDDGADMSLDETLEFALAPQSDVGHPA